MKDFTFVTFFPESADDNFEGTIKTNLVVQANGSILFVPPGIFKSIYIFAFFWISKIVH